MSNRNKLTQEVFEKMCRYQVSTILSSKAKCIANSNIVHRNKWWHNRYQNLDDSLDLIVNF